MDMRRFILLTLLTVFSLTFAFAQSTREVRGTVIDVYGNPIPGARVEATGGAETTVTDADGTFSIEVSQWLVSLTVTYPGLGSKTVNLQNGQNEYLVRMQKKSTSWRVRVGGGMSTFVDIEEDLVAGASSEMKFRFSGKVGVEFEYPLTSSVSIIPALELAMKGATYSYTYSGNTIDANYHPIYLQIPVLASYRMAVSKELNLCLKAGPYFAYGIKGNVDVDGGDDVDMFSDLDAKRFDLGIGIGTDIEYQRYLFGLQFERGLNKIDKGGDSGYNEVIYLSVGYKF